MEEKKIQRRHTSFWSFFGFFRDNFSIFRKSAGFTLVELLVVIGIIGILVAAVLLVLNPFAQIQKSNDAKRKGDLAQIQRALETHYNDLGSYPLSNSSYQILWKNSPVAWGASWLPYMATLPKDPVFPNRTYVYYSDGQKYRIYAALERPDDKQLCLNGVCPNLPSGATCGAACNFGVTSSNTSP